MVGVIVAFCCPSKRFCYSGKASRIAIDGLRCWLSFLLFEGDHFWSWPILYNDRRYEMGKKAGGLRAAGRQAGVHWRDGKDTATSWRRVHGVSLADHWRRATPAQL